MNHFSQRRIAQVIFAISIWAAVIGMTSVAGIAITMAQSECNENSECVDLLKADIIRIQKIDTINTLPVFSNPLLQMEIDVDSSSPMIQIHLPDYTEDMFNLNPREDANHCELLIAAMILEDDFLEAVNNNVTPEPSLVVEIDPNEPGDLRLYAFCKHNNLPLDNEGNQGAPFPTNLVFDSTVDNFTSQTNAPGFTATNGDLSFLTPLFDHLGAGDCQATVSDEEPAKMLGYTDMASQIAVFIAYDYINDGQLDLDAAYHQAVWDTYWGTHHSTVFREQYAGIYCLLGWETEPLITQLRVRQGIANENADFGGDIPLQEIIATADASPIVTSTVTSTETPLPEASATEAPQREPDYILSDGEAVFLEFVPQTQQGIVTGQNLSVKHEGIELSTCSTPAKTTDTDETVYRCKLVTPGLYTVSLETLGTRHMLACTNDEGQTTSDCVPAERAPSQVNLSFIIEKQQDETTIQMTPTPIPFIDRPLIGGPFRTLPLTWALFIIIAIPAAIVVGTVVLNMVMSSMWRSNSRIRIIVFVLIIALLLLIATQVLGNLAQPSPAANAAFEILGEEAA